MERVSSAVRLELRPGEWVLWKARPFRFVSLNGSTASIRDSINAELHEVAVTDLRGMQVYRARPRNRVIPTYSTLDAFDVVALP